jgi:hypothetical protein
MKLSILISIISGILYAFVILSACKKDNVSNATLLITVTNNIDGDAITNYPGGIQIYLYVNKSDYGNINKAVESEPIGANGDAIFTNLSCIEYYFQAQGACGSNAGSDITTSGPLIAGETNIASTVFTGVNGCIP